MTALETLRLRQLEELLAEVKTIRACLKELPLTLPNMKATFAAAACQGTLQSMVEHHAKGTYNV